MLARDQIPLVWRDWPFVGKPHNALRPSGMSIEELVQSVKDELPPMFFVSGEVRVNDVPVPHEKWKYVRPRCRHDYDIVVTFHFHAARSGGGGQGGKGGKSPLQTILSLAIMATALVISGGALGAGGFLDLGLGLFAKGSTSALILAFGVSTVGSLAVAALSPPPVANASTIGGGAGASDQGADTTDDKVAALQGNTLQPGGPIPRVVGTRRVAPPMSRKPLVERIGNDEYAEAHYIMAGPHSFSDFRFGDTSTDLIPDLDMEVIEGLPGDGNTALAARQSETDTPSLELSRHQTDPTTPINLLDQLTPSNSVPQFHPVTTLDSFDEVWVRLDFQEGITDFSSITTKYAVPIRMQIRLKGAEQWRNIPEFHITSKSSARLQKIIKIFRRKKPLVVPDTPTDETAYVAYASVPAQTATPAAAGWTADSYFRGGTTGSAIYSAANFGTHDVRGISLTQDGVEIFLDPDEWEAGTYEVQFKQGNMYSTSAFTVSTYMFSGVVWDLFGYQTSAGTSLLQRTRAQVHDKCVITRVDSIWNEHPIASGNFAQIAVRVKNRSLQPLTVLASGLVRDWNGTDWGTYTASSNPAPHTVDALCGRLNADPISTSLLDSLGLVAWRQACIDNEYTIDAVFQGTSVDDARLLMAACGYGRPAQTPLYGVIRDRDRSNDTPKQILSPRTLSSLRWEKAFPSKPDGYRAIFPNQEKDYIDDERQVLRDGVVPGPKNRLEEVRYAGLVAADSVITRATFDLAQLDARGVLYYGTAPVRAIQFTLGDMVGVQHDIVARAAGFARVKTVMKTGTTVVGLVLDSSVPSPGSNFLNPESFLHPRTFLTGNPHAAAIECDDDSTLVVRLDDDDSGYSDTDTITFTTPFDDPNERIVEGAHITTGLLGLAYKRLIVFDMKPKKQLQVDLTFLDEAPELWENAAYALASSIDGLASAVTRASLTA